MDEIPVRYRDYVGKTVMKPWNYYNVHIEDRLHMELYSVIEKEAQIAVYWFYFQSIGENIWLKYWNIKDEVYYNTNAEELLYEWT